MKVFLKVLIVFTFLGCGGPKQIVKNPVGQPKEKVCVLPLLAETINYRHNIENYKSIYKDTVVEIESVTADLVTYKTVLDLKKSGHFLWLINIKEKESDSILIDCVSTTKWVEANFDLENCKIQLEYEDFDENGLPKNGGTEIVNFINF